MNILYRNSANIEGLLISSKKNIRIGKTRSIMKKSLLLLSFLFLWVIGLKAQNLRISGSNNHSVIICSNGSVFAWGDNTAGQLGLDPETGQPYGLTNSPDPVKVGGLSEIFQIDAGSGAHTLALTCDGQVMAWGSNMTGQLGNGEEGVNQAEPVKVVGIGGTGVLDGVSYVSGGNDESFAILETKELVAWGQNDKGQLGTGAPDANNQLYPDYVRTGPGTPLTNVKMVEAGDENGYALADPDEDGVFTVYSWGDSDENQGLALGRPITDPYWARPVEKEDGSPLDNIVSISAGDRHCLAIDADGNLWAWGGDWGNGQVGDGYNQGGYYTQLFATQVVAGELAADPADWKTEYLGGPDNPVVSIAAGQAHSIAALADGTVVTWGSNGFFNLENGSTPSGQLGAGPGRFETHASYTDADGVNTAPIVGMKCDGTPLTDVVEVSDGDAWSFALTSDGKIWVTGFNEGGQLGTGTTTSSFCFRELEVPDCGVAPPCPNPDLGNDFTICPTFTRTLSAGIVPTNFKVRWFYNDEPVDSVTVTGLPEEVTYDVIDELGEWKVEIEDLREPTNRPCEPCAIGKDSILIEPIPLPFDTVFNTYCGDSAVFKIQNADGQFKWYGSETSTVMLDSTGTTTGLDSAKVAISDVEEIIEDSLYRVWVQDVTVRKDSIAPSDELCGSWDGEDFNITYTMFSAFKELTIDTISIFIRATGTGSGSVTPVIYNGTQNNNGQHIYDATDTYWEGSPFTFNFTQNDEIEVKIPVNAIVAPGNNYWFGFSDKTGNFAFKTRQCGSSTDWTTYKDHLEDGGIIQLSSSYSNGNPSPDKFGAYYNWRISKKSDYPCGRIPVYVRDLCPPCQAPTTLDLTFNGDDVVSGDDINLCVGDPLVLDTTNLTLPGSENGGYHYQWVYVGESDSTGYPAVPDTITEYKPIDSTAVTLAAAGKYKIRIIDGKTAEDKKCYLEDSVYVNVFEIPTAEILNTGDSLKYCEGEDGVILFADSVGKATYTWYYKANGTGTDFVEQTGSTADKFLEAKAGLWTVVVTSENGCIDSLVTPVEVEEIPLPDAPTVNATPNPICEGEDILLEVVPATTADSIRWIFPDATDADGFVSTKLDSTREAVTTDMDGTYTAFVYLNGCRSAGGDTLVTVNEKPDKPVIEDFDPICEGDSVNLQSNSVSGTTFSYNWYGPNSWTVSGDSEDEQNPTVTPSSVIADHEGTYYAYFTVDGCNSDTSEVDVVINPVPDAPTVSGDSEVCENEQNIVYSVTLNAGSTYEWIVPDTSGATIKSGQTTSEITINAGSKDIAIQVAETSASGCTSDTTTYLVDVIESTSVSVTIDGDDKICAGKGGNYNATPIGAGTNPQYEWYYNGTLDETTTDTLYSRTSFTGAAPYVIEVKLIPDVKCPIDTPATDNMTVTVQTNLEPEVAITQPDTLCEGSPAQFFPQTEETGGETVTYNWFVNGLQQTVTTDANFNPTDLENEDEVFVEIRVPNTGCFVDTVDTSNVVVVYVDEKPSNAAINEGNPLNTCISCETVSAAAVTVGEIAWFIKDDATDPANITDNGDGTAEICDLQPGETSQVILTVSNGVCPADSATLDVVRTSALTTPEVTNDTLTVCETTSSVTLTGLGAASSETESWVNSDGTFTSTDNPLVLQTATDLTVGSENIYFYKIENGAGCKDSVQVSIFVDETPSPATLAEDTLRTCDVEIELNATAPTVGTGQWYKNSGQGTITDDADPVSMLTDLDATGNSTLYWVISNGVCKADSATLIVEKLGEVTTPLITLDGGDYSMLNVTNDTKELCLQENYDIIGNSPASDETATWGIKSGTSVTVTEDGTESQTLTLNSQGTTVLTWTIERNLPGCAPIEREVTLDVRDVPAQPGAITGDDEVCAGESALQYKITGADPYTTYKWISSDVTLVGSTDGPNVYVDVPNNAPATSEIKVIAENSCGSSDTTRFQITVNPNEAPVVDVVPDKTAACYGDTVTFTANITGDGLASSHFEGFIWYLDDVPVTVGATYLTDSLLPSNKVRAEAIYDLENTCIDPSVLNSNDAVESNHVNVDITLPPSVDIEIVDVDGTDICENADAEFRAEGDNFGSSPQYTWWVDNVEVSTTNPYETNTLTDGQEVKVQVTSTGVCPAADRDSLIVNVIPIKDVSVDVTVSEDELCEGDPTIPTFTATPTNGGSNPEYTWSIGGDVKQVGPSPEFTPNNQFDDVGAHSVQVVLVSSIERCTDPETGEALNTATVTVYDKPDPEIDGQYIFCPDGTLQLTATPVGANYSYQWTKVGGGNVGTDDYTLTVGEEGSYQVEVTDNSTALACSDISSPRQAQEFDVDALGLNVTSSRENFDHVKCEEYPIQLVATYGPDYTYSWTLGDGTSRTSLSYPDDAYSIKVEDAGLYEVTFEIANPYGEESCSATLPITVEDTIRPRPIIVQGDTTICEGDSYVLEVINGNDNGVTGFYTWKRNGVEVASGKDNFTYTVTQSGEYTVVEDYVGYCPEEAPQVVEVEVETNPIAEAGPDLYRRQGDAAELLGSYSEYASKYTWTSPFDPNIVPLSADGSDVVVSPDSTTMYWLTVESNSGYCTDTDSVTVHIELNVRPWNSFSPNGDGIYDTWIIENLGDYPDALIEVYNRWGTLVWKSTGYGDAWDGTNFRNGQILPVATYYYVIYPNGGAVNDPLTGPVTIVK